MTAITWSELVVLISTASAPIIYFIKRYYDYKSKKQEINHSIYQQNRITILTRFFEHYTKVDRIFKQISFYQIMDYHHTATILDDMTVKPLNELRSCVWELGLYFKPEVHKHFNTISTNFGVINGTLIDPFYTPPTPEPRTSRSRILKRCKP